MNPTEILESYRQQIDQALEGLFQSKQPKTFFEPMAYPVLAGGKRLRPILLVLSQQLIGGNKDHGLQAGLAIELLHTFTLVHDDIMDHDDTRRGFPTVHKKWDEATAILSGDGLVTLAYDTLFSIDHPKIIQIAKIFTEGLLVLCEGQALDKAFETLDSVPMSSYQEMIQKKTAKLIEVSCEIGTILGGGSNDDMAHIKQYAYDLGMAFQIQDDLLDLIGSEKNLGKPIGSDLYEKKKTFLVIHFLEQADDNQQKIFDQIWNKDKISEEDVEKIKTLFNETMTIQITKNKIQRHIQSAINNLDYFKSSQSKEMMQFLTDKLLHRSS